MAEIAGGMPYWSNRSSGGFHAHAVHRVQIEAQPAQPPTVGIWRDARMGDIKAAERRIAHGADVDELDSVFLLPPLAWAVLYGQTELAKLLIDYGADVNMKDGTGNRPLHTAVFMGETEAAKLLIKNGAEIGAKNHNGQTPSDSAASPFQTTFSVGAVFNIPIDKKRFADIEKNRAEILKLLNKP